MIHRACHQQSGFFVGAMGAQTCAKLYRKATIHRVHNNGDFNWTTSHEFGARNTPGIDTDDHGPRPSDFGIPGGDDAYETTPYPVVTASGDNHVEVSYRLGAIDGPEWSHYTYDLSLPYDDSALGSDRDTLVNAFDIEHLPYSNTLIYTTRFYLGTPLTEPPAEFEGFCSVPLAGDEVLRVREGLSNYYCYGKGTLGRCLPVDDAAGVFCAAWTFFVQRFKMRFLGGERSTLLTYPVSCACQPSCLLGEQSGCSELVADIAGEVLKLNVTNTATVLELGHTCTPPLP